MGKVLLATLVGFQDTLATLDLWTSLLIWLAWVDWSNFVIIVNREDPMIIGILNQVDTSG